MKRTKKRKAPVEAVARSGCEIQVCSDFVFAFQCARV